LAEKENAGKCVEIGVIGRPHGIKGAFRLFLYNPSSQVLRIGQGVRLCSPPPGGESSARLVAAVQRSGKYCIVRLEGIERREQAAELTGAHLLVSRGDLPRLDDGEFYVDDLIGLDVWQDGRLLGAISGSREQGGVEVINVSDGERDLEIPLVGEFVVDIDFSGRRVEVRDTGDLPSTPRAARRDERV
jgi:16S rRNA processing protein RimM